MSFESSTPIDLVTDGTPITYGVVQPGPEDENGVLFIRGGDISAGRINTASLRTISSELSLQYKRTLLRGGELLISLVGNPGEVAIAPVELAGSNIARQVGLIRVDEKRFNPWFIQYYLMSPAGKAQLFSYSLGSVQSVINLKELKRVEIPNVPIEIQNSIIKSLKDIDDKIDLNRRINQTLETMAQAIFKSWFVDFDPVKAQIAAKQEGRDPLRAAMTAISGKLNAKLDTLPPEQYEQLAATAALFPDEMEKSELGEIPRGWNPTPIRDVASVVKGKSYSSKDLVDNDQVALVTLKSFERGGGFRMDGFKPYVGPYKSEQVVLPGDLIVAYTDVTQAAELIGKPAVVVGVDDFKTLVASLDVGIVRPVNQRVSRQFLYGLFMTDAFQSHTFAHTSGTTVLHLAKEGVPSYIFACPDETLVGIYSEAAETMATKKQKLLDQNRSLATLRDTLLPQLLSGELLVTEVSAEAEA